VAELPIQKVVDPVIVGTGFGFSTKITEVSPVHPEASVTVKPTFPPVPKD